MDQKKQTPNESTVPALLKREEIAEILRITTRTLTRLVAAGSFPAPFHIGSRSRWIATEVKAFLQQKGSGACVELLDRTVNLKEKDS